MAEGESDSIDSTAPPPRGGRRRGRLGLWLLASLVLIAGVAGLGLLALTGRPLALPGWAVAQIETRLNAALPVDQTQVALGGIEITVGRDWVPRLRLTDLRLAQGGAMLLRLPEARLSLEPAGLLAGQVRPLAVTLVGMSARLRRDAAGRFDLNFGGSGQMQSFGSFAEAIDRLDALFSAPALAPLARVEAEALSLTLEDARAGRVWQIGDGRFVLANDGKALAMELGLTLAVPGGAPAQAQLQVTSDKTSSAARLRATVDRVAAADIAAQAPLLALFSVVDAPLSGRLTAALDERGRLSAFSGGIGLGAGALHPSAESRPVAFDGVRLDLGFDPAAERLHLDLVEVQSRALRLRAQGHIDAPGVLTGRPEDFLAQIAVSQLMVDPEGLFVKPVTFSQGALDMRLRLDPFRIDIGQFTLLEQGRRLTARGSAQADAQGWTTALDLALDAIGHEALLALWPVSAVPKTRQWLVENVQEGLMRNVRVALRSAPGQEPRLSLGYDFTDADVRFIKTLPPIRNASGYARLEGNTYTMVLDAGGVTPPEGGRIDAAGTVFSVLDILHKPAQAEIRLRARSSLTAALSLLDQKPFSFLTKAGKPVALGQGRAEISAVLRLPLVPKVRPDQVSFSVTGDISDLVSEVIVPGRRLTADRLALTATPAALEVSGPARLGAAPFRMVWRQGLRREDQGRATVEGTAELSPAVIDEFRLGLPEGMVTGQGEGAFHIDFEKGQPPRLRLTSDLRGLTLALPELFFRKAPATPARLEVEAVLGKPAEVTRLMLDAPGLTLEGRVALAPEGGLARADFTRLRAGDWLDGTARLTGRGRGRLPDVALTGGTLDLRRLPEGARAAAAAGGGRPFTVALDRLRLGEGLALTALRGDFTTRGGFNGSFTAQVNGQASLRGTVVPMDQGTGVRLTSDDAGAVLAAAGIFPNARGGTLEVQLVPLGPRGQYDGTATARNFRVRKTPLLAELLSAISVVGLLDQLNGGGILFSDGDARFRVTPAGVEIAQGAAVGASMGVSAAGAYDFATRRFDLQGTISPVYLLNGIGRIFARQGEGLFGFNYTIQGSPGSLRIGVNPLSIFTPGMFREIFRRPVPRLKETG